MKTSLLIMLICLTLQSCGRTGNKKQGDRQEVGTEESVVRAEPAAAPDEVLDNIEEIRMLERFYREYLTEMMKDDLGTQGAEREEQIKRRYVAPDLLDRISGDEGLDYNPFINAQDYDDNWLKTLEVTRHDLKPGVYLVTFVNGHDGKTKRIELSVTESDGKYAIGDINLRLQAYEITGLPGDAENPFSVTRELKGKTISEAYAVFLNDFPYEKDYFLSEIPAGLEDMPAQGYFVPNNTHHLHYAYWGNGNLRASRTVGELMIMLELINKDDRIILKYFLNQEHD